ncbi:MAG: glycoside hydrolase family 9 protein [Bacteroidota bacterium]
MKKIQLLLLAMFACGAIMAQENTWIRINQLGYPTKGIKLAVWGSKQNNAISNFELVDAKTGNSVYTHSAGKAFGRYGPFTETYRLDFSAFTKAGTYFLRTGKTQSPVFTIDDDVYKGAADFCLRYMRQQRSGFNPFLKDSCHTHDGYTMYGPMPDSTHIDVTGGWHDASDYLQYTTTSANATWHLLSAYRDFPGVFGDVKQANGLDGKNGTADVLDEAKWGLDWLLKMNPRNDWMFNQLGDDRDHMGMRIPKEDTYYGKGFERPVYFVNGKPQQRGKFMNATTGTASTAGKFASTFALAAGVYQKKDPALAKLFTSKAIAAYQFGVAKPGVAQTVSVKSPYIYAEGDWADDMELAAAQLYGITKEKKYEQDFYHYLRIDSVAKWMGKDTAEHYQYYPFNNLGIYAMDKIRGVNAYNLELELTSGEVLNRVAVKAEKNAFNRAVPFIWCSNNLTASLAIACYWYRTASGKNTYAELEQANFDWLFGCNPWGTSMVYGLPANGDTPVDPHSAFTHLKNYPIDGGLVDGPVYTSIYKGLIGIQLKDADEYADFQSDLAVYHDDYGDYSTNEPTMDGTASLIYLLAAKENTYNRSIAAPISKSQGAVIRGDSTKRQVALVFTGDEFGDGLTTIANTLQKQNVKGSFFFTGRFYQNKSFESGIKKLYQQKHLLGPHSDQHLLYNDWTERSKTLVTKDSMLNDLGANEKAISKLGIINANPKHFFIPPYEWWNEEVASWLKSASYQVFSFTPGTTSNADYTWPEMGKSYKSSDAIMASIKQFNETRPGGLNGVVLLIHAGTDPRRKDKLYNRLDELIVYLKKEGYDFKRIDELFR